MTKDKIEEQFAWVRTLSKEFRLVWAMLGPYPSPVVFTARSTESERLHDRVRFAPVLFKRESDLDRAMHLDFYAKEEMAIARKIEGKWVFFKRYTSVSQLRTEYKQHSRGGYAQEVWKEVFATMAPVNPFNLDPALVPFTYGLGE